MVLTVADVIVCSASDRWLGTLVSGVGDRRIHVLGAAQLRGNQVNISTQTKEKPRGSFLFPSLETLSRKKYSFIHPSKSTY